MGREGRGRVDLAEVSRCCEGRVASCPTATSDIVKSRPIPTKSPGFINHTPHVASIYTDLMMLYGT